MSRREAIALASENLEQLLGVGEVESSERDFIATRGGDLLSMQAKVVAHISPRQSAVVLF
jgi:hypothetical protein